MKLLHIIKGSICFFSICILFAAGLNAQTITINGEDNPSTGAEEYYEASFDYSVSPYTNFTWTVNGGYIVDQGINPTMTVWVTVQWNNTDGTGWVRLDDDIQSIYGERIISIGQGCHVANGGGNKSICAGGSGVTIGTTAVSGYTYSWYPTTGLSNAAIAQPTANPSVTTTYTLTMTPPNLITNPSFESGATGFSTDLLTYPNELPNGHGNYQVTTNANNMGSTFCNMGDHSASGTYMLVVDGELNNFSSNHRMWYTTINVDPNTDYTFSGWVSTASGNSESFKAWITGNSSGSTSTTVNLSANCANWTQFSLAFNSGANTSVTLKLTFNYGNSDLAIDDLYFGPCSQTTDQVTVTVGTAPPVVTPPGPITYYNQYESVNYVTLTCNDAPSYQWYKNNNAISGATSKTYTFSFQGLSSSTDYYKCVTSCGTSNVVTFNYVGCDEPSDYPGSVNTEVCISTYPISISQPDMGSGGLYYWELEPSCFSLTNISDVYDRTASLNYQSCGLYGNGLYTRAVATSNTEMRMYVWINPNQGCRMALGPVNSEQPSNNGMFQGNFKTQLLPNPASDRVTVTSPKKIMGIEIYTMLGARVKTFRVGDLNKLEIPLSGLAPGLYSVRVITRDGFKSLKLLIQ